MVILGSNEMQHNGVLIHDFTFSNPSNKNPMRETPYLGAYITAAERMIDKLEPSEQVKVRQTINSNYEFILNHCFKQTRNTDRVPTSITLTIGDSKVIVNGASRGLDAAPYIKPGVSRTMVPARAVAEAMLFDVQWIEDSKKVVITDAATTIILSIGSNVAEVNGGVVKMDTSAEIINNRTFIPLRFVAENLGGAVTWNGENRQIIIER